MKILCLFQKFSFQYSTIYLDLVEALAESGHMVTVLAGTSENVEENRIYEESGCRVVYVKVPDQFHAGKIKKGLVQLLMEPKMLGQIKHHLWKDSFDLILYPTPPITLANVVKQCRKHFQAKSYLMLKDIFPQNAVDLGMMRAGGLLHRYFCKVEQKLYENSDYIGCMSDANINYMKHRLKPELQKRLECFPNTVRIREKASAGMENVKSLDEPVRFVFGGNLGKPQNIDFLLQGIERLKDFSKAEFLIIGDGTEAKKTEQFLKEHKCSNARYQRQLPREEYEEILQRQDVGMVLLSSRFTIPNYPSRILSYMQRSKPILAVTDKVTDLKELVTKEAECGYWCASDDIGAFADTIHTICEEREGLVKLGENGHNYFVDNFSVKKSVSILESHFK